LVSQVHQVIGGVSHGGDYYHNIATTVARRTDAPSYVLDSMGIA
jgi:hypothetical protein